MNVRGIVAAVVLIFLVGCTCRGAEHAHPPECVSVYAAADESVVRIDTPDGGVGSGFVYPTRNYIATAGHVAQVETPGLFLVTFTDGATEFASVAIIDERNDLAILKLAEPTDEEPLKVRDTSDVALGTSVAAIGNPFGLHSITVGVVSGFGKFPLLQTDAPINPGNSGGPLFSCGGEVVGVIVSYLPTAKSMGWAEPGWLLAPLAKRLNVADH